jgi:uroporphyrinogen decarboxylase
MIQNRRLLDVLNGKQVDRPPVWLMRQAGRYLPEYNVTRGRAGSFMALCKNADLATEVVLQPLERFPLDAAILFSDILTIPDAMGLGLEFRQGEGPFFTRPLQTESDVRALTVPDMADLQYVFNAVVSMRKALNDRVPLIGFSGSPFTLACYMVQGHSEEGFSLVKRMLYSRPDLLEHIIQINTETVTQYLIEQVKAGAQVLMLFDTWGGLLSAYDYQRWSLAPMQTIVQRLSEALGDQSVPIILFTKGGGTWLKSMVATGVRGIGLDWTVDLSWAREQVGASVCLQGNLDPHLLFGSEQAIDEAVDRLMASVRGQPHIVNLGHGIMPGTPIDAVARFVSSIQRFDRS